LLLDGWRRAGLFIPLQGTQVRDTSDDETDGMDEALVPVDYEHAGVIVVRTAAIARCVSKLLNFA
jgi:hypothetical protein